MILLNITYEILDKYILFKYIIKIMYNKLRNFTKLKELVK